MRSPRQPRLRPRSARPRPRSRRQELWTGKRDVPRCFYRCKLPAAWYPYLGLPAVRAAEVWSIVKGKFLEFPRKGGVGRVHRRVRPNGRVDPMLGVVAIGFSHGWILRTVSRMRAAAVSREWGLRPLEALSRVWAGVIVDDLCVVGLRWARGAGRSRCAPLGSRACLPFSRMDRQGL